MIDKTSIKTRPRTRLQKPLWQECNRLPHLTLDQECSSSIAQIHYKLTHNFHKPKPETLTLTFISVMHFEFKASILQLIYVQSSTMKITNSTVKGMERNSRETSNAEVPPLPLVPDENELDEDRGCKTGSFKLLSDPTDVGSSKYSFTMAYADGTQSIRFHLQWAKNVNIILQGMNIVNGPAQATRSSNFAVAPSKLSSTSVSRIYAAKQS